MPLMGFSPPVIWAAFAACLLLIFYSGTRLSYYGELIGLRTGLGGTWVGVALIATVTSLPELVTGLSSVLAVGQPDLAVGDALGSCVFNLFIIVILDFVYREGSIYTRMHQGHILSAGFGVVFLGLVAGNMLLHRHFGALAIGPIGPYAIVALLLYGLSVRAILSYQRRERAEQVSEVVEAVEALSPARGGLSTPALYTRYAANAAVIVAAGTVLPLVGEMLATTMGWERTFVGTILLAVATSIPEIVISVQAVRIGAVDLAIGDLLGSNLFDLLILAVDDVAYVKSPLLAAASPEHLFTTVAALAMTGVVIVGLSYRPRARVLRLVGWASLALVAVALLNAWILYLLS